MPSYPKQRDDDLGALWWRDGQRGPYLSGTINGVRVVAFPNADANEENRQPAFRVKRALAPEQRRAAADGAAD